VGGEPLIYFTLRLEFPHVVPNDAASRPENQCPGLPNERGILLNVKQEVADLQRYGRIEGDGKGRGCELQKRRNTRMETLRLLL
jgi:hypothetical protein